MKMKRMEMDRISRWKAPLWMGQQQNDFCSRVIPVHFR